MNFLKKYRGDYDVGVLLDVVHRGLTPRTGYVVAHFN